MKNIRTINKDILFLCIELIEEIGIRFLKTEFIIENKCNFLLEHLYD